ncbi:MAG: aminotransferase class I/II-fold pyridoxal phosphate-dependent enzyme [Planctomyces sp.]|jgi:dTDP-4-amino-4,6-dideoxygalactose transaminase
MKVPERTPGILGGTPAFPEPLHVGRPNIGSHAALQERLADILNRRWLTNDGPMVREFEKRICELTNVRHCVAICNATIALEIAIRAAGLTGEVIVPSYTFISTAHSLQWQQVRPVFCDIDPATHNIDPAKVESLITPQTSGILATHVWGRPCDTDALQRIADRHGLKLLFDAAHAFGCSHRRRMIGGFGLAEIFSFHATKFINCFEGGAVVTNDDSLASTMRYMRNFGFAGLDRVDYIGTNGKVTEICAAMGLTSLESMAEFIQCNKKNYETYRHFLDGIPGIRLCQYDEKESCNFQYVVIEVDEKMSGISRDVLVAVLTAENILARKYFWPGCHRMQPYRTLYPESGQQLPETEQTSARVVVLPTGTAVSIADIEVICSIIHEAIRNSGLITSHVVNNRLCD